MLALFALLMLNYLLLLIDEYSDLHPYKGEISKLMKNPNVGILELFDGCEKKWSLEMGGSYEWVEDEAQLRELVEVLSNEKMLAVDTEQHSLRSFLGFTALIQVHVYISTRKFPSLGARLGLFINSVHWSFSCSLQCACGVSIFNIPRFIVFGMHVKLMFIYLRQLMY